MGISTMKNKGVPALNNLFANVTLDYAHFKDKCLQELFPADCEDKLQFIIDHEIHLRNYPAENVSELWMDDKRVGTFSQHFDGTTYTVEFTK